MSGIFGRIRSGAGQVAFEADKLRRINSVQSIIKSLHSEIKQTFSRIGRVTFELYRAERITQPELQEVCGHLAILQAQVVARENEIEAIRNETYVEPQRGSQYARLCPNGHGELPAQAKFCPVCGAPASAVTSNFCPACGAELVPGARFCPECGAGAPQPTPAPPAVEAAPPTVVERSLFAPPAVEPPPIPEDEPGPLAPEEDVISALLDEPQDEALTSAEEPRNCPDCGAALVPEAIFCPDCGQNVVSASETIAPSPPMVEPESPPMAIEPLPVPEDELGPLVPEEEVTSVLLDESQDEALPPAEEPRHCPNCGASLILDAMFCPDCGEEMASITDVV